MLCNLPADAHAIFAAGVASVQAPALMARFEPRALLGKSLSGFRRVAVLGAGKAALGMAGALEAAHPSIAFEGEVVVPYGYAEAQPHGLPAPRRVAVRAAGHPVPDGGSAAAACAALELAREAGADDLVLVLLSGGGSALWTCPPAPVTLADMRALTRALLASGAPIEALNTVRKAASKIAGGRLARAAMPATLATLVVSDVVGDDLATIASAPTVGAPPRRSEAMAVLREAGVWADLPPRLRAYFEADETERAAEQARGATQLLGTNRDALEAACARAETLGYAARIVTATMEGEAREVGAAHARALLEAETERPACLLWGGETTVTLGLGSGRGGRNQEAALAAALILADADHDAVLFCAGTDGLDGPTDAAGGWATPRTLARALAAGLDAQAHLARHDAYPLLEATGHLLAEGPTHTNVADLHIGLVAPR